MQKYFLCRILNKLTNCFKINLYQLLMKILNTESDWRRWADKNSWQWFQYIDWKSFLQWYHGRCFKLHGQGNRYNDTGFSSWSLHAQYTMWKYWKCTVCWIANINILSLAWVKTLIDYGLFKGSIQVSPMNCLSVQSNRILVQFVVEVF